MRGEPGSRASARKGGDPAALPVPPGGAVVDVLVDRTGHLPGGEDPAVLLVGWVPDRRTRAEVLDAMRRMRSGDLVGGRHWVLPGPPPGGCLLAVRPEFDAEGNVEGVRLLRASGPDLARALSAWMGGIEAVAVRYARAWRRAEQRVRTLFDGSPDMHVLVDTRGRVREVNRAVREIAGWPREAISGRHVARLVPARERSRLASAIRLVQATGRVTDFETRVLRADGLQLEVSASAVLVRGEDERPEGAHLVLRDVTRRNRLQRRIWQADRLAITGRIAAGVAHEINNPLQAILMHLALLEERLPRDPGVRQAWNRVRNGVERIRGIVSDLLDLHRGGREAEPQPTDVNRVVFEALELVQVPIRHQGIRLQVSLADDLPPVRAVEQHLYQVMLNLLLNAIGAMPGGGTLVLRTRWRPAVREVEIGVSDSGAGIPEDLLPHIFDPFHGGEDSPGTGLGLFVTWGLVRRQGGRIEVDSAPDRGTTFRVFLPAGPGAGEW